MTTYIEQLVTSLFYVAGPFMVPNSFLPWEDSTLLFHYFTFPTNSTECPSPTSLSYVAFKSDNRIFPKLQGVKGGGLDFVEPDFLENPQVVTQYSPSQSLDVRVFTMSSFVWSWDAPDLSLMIALRPPLAWAR